MRYIIKTIIIIIFTSIYLSSSGEVSNDWLQYKDKVYNESLRFQYIATKKDPATYKPAKLTSNIQPYSLPSKSQDFVKRLANELAACQSDETLFKVTEKYFAELLGHPDQGIREQRISDLCNKESMDASGIKTLADALIKILGAGFQNIVNGFCKPINSKRIQNDQIENKSQYDQSALKTARQSTDENHKKTELQSAITQSEIKPLSSFLNWIWNILIIACLVAIVILYWIQQLHKKSFQQMQSELAILEGEYTALTKKVTSIQHSITGSTGSIGNLKHSDSLDYRTKEQPRIVELDVTGNDKPIVQPQSSDNQQQKPIQYFAKFADQQDGFSIASLTKEKSPSTNFQIEFNQKDNTGTFWIMEDPKVWVNVILAVQNILGDKVSEIQNYPSSQQDKLVNVRKGTVKLVNGDFKVTNKLVINFIKR